jgi:hypothetical protein
VTFKNFFRRAKMCASAMAIGSYCECDPKAFPEIFLSSKASSLLTTPD